MPVLQPSEALFGALAGAEDSLSRLDTRLADSADLQGWLARTHLQEAVAWLWNQGELISLEDLALHDARLDIRTPDTLVTAARAALGRRRRAARMAYSELACWDGALHLMRRRPGPPSTSEGPRALNRAQRARRPWWEEPEEAPPPPPFSFLDAMKLPETRVDDERAAFELWMTPPTALDGWPGLIGAIVRLDRWALLAPCPRASDIGDLIVQAELVAKRRLHSAPLLIQAGRRRLNAKTHKPAPLGAEPYERAVYWLNACQQGAKIGLEELDSLAIARQRLERHLVGRRVSSRMPKLVELLLNSPLVTAPQAAASLEITQQAVRAMMDELGDVAREATGRRSFRAWRV